MKLMNGTARAIDTTVTRVAISPQQAGARCSCCHTVGAGAGAGAAGAAGRMFRISWKKMSNALARGK